MPGEAPFHFLSPVWTLPFAMTSAAPIVVALDSYTDEEKGGIIKEADVIRAENGRWCARAEVEAFRQKSRMRCPTYGNCCRCWRSGPVAKWCDRCQARDAGFQVVALTWRPFSGTRRLVDAEFLARFLGQGHPPARADRPCHFRTPLTHHSPGELASVAVRCGREVRDLQRELLDPAERDMDAQGGPRADA